MKFPKAQLTGTTMSMIGGAVVLFAVAAAIFIATDRRSPDEGGVAATRIAGGAPVAANNPMSPVTQDEANKRATVNAEQAAAAQARKQGYVAQPVIVATESPRPAELPPVQARAAAPEPAARTLASGPVAPAAAPAPVAAPGVLYAYAQPLDDSDLRSKVDSQIDAILKPPSGSYSVRTYAKPAESAGEATAAGGLTRQQASSAAVSSILAARSGDTAYAMLDRAFNSVDPQAPVFATIFDHRDGGATGPLHGARVMGQITFNRDQAALTFATLVMPSGYQVPIKALGISETDGRTGVAASVDYHTFERYSGLLVAGLIQGAGQVGQQLIQNNQTQTYTANGTLVTQSNPTTWLQGGLAAVQPVGTALSSAAAGSFNRAPTISAPAAMGLGIVFLEPLQLPLEQIRRSQALVRASEQQR